eukprot:CAMPEP_0204527642 /NCGR_PEP_ID=MMETSP0661-20131031/9096_1 /ASSEMBLY_ACC=CAM_ASM_000606 /TAXON_ID=109239 /ORGANISM="Alexandrium margalefi, Strain AMGDE01CS-322" /LENGTH=102 /DNA_ID=CAMNT_0051533571 /DNA_START=12 /DNA_END=316 /DNA_ORIENTATION=+
MPGDRTWRSALCLLAAPIHDAYAAGAVSHHLAASSSRRQGLSLSLLQLDQAHAAVHSQGVTPEFFEDASAPTAHAFEPVASRQTVAAVQAAAESDSSQSVAA